MIPPPPPPPPPHDPHAMEANGRYASKVESPGWIVFLNVVNALTQILLGAVAFSAFCFAGIFSASNSFSQHVYLCVIGYVILMSQAILSFNSTAGWTHSLKYPQKKAIHWILQVVGSIFAITGSVIRFNDMTDNFETAHAITGFVAMILTILSLIGGMLSLIFPAQMSAVLFRIVHIGLGAITITMAFVSLCLGFDGVYRFIFGDLNANLSITLTVFALLGVHTSAFAKVYKRLNE